MFLLFCISSPILSQTPFALSSHPRCSPHLVPRDLPTPARCCHAVSMTDPARRTQCLQKHAAGEGEKPHRELVTARPNSTARTAQLVFVSPHQCEGNERSERASLLVLVLSSLFHCPGCSLCPRSSCHVQTSPASAAAWQRSWPDPATVYGTEGSPPLLCAHAHMDMK